MFPFIVQELYKTMGFEDITIKETEVCLSYEHIEESGSLKRIRIDYAGLLSAPGQ